MVPTSDSSTGMHPRCHILSYYVLLTPSGEHFQFISIQFPDDAKNKTTRRLAQSHAVKRALRIKRMLQQGSGDNFRVTTSEDHCKARRLGLTGTPDRSFCSGLDPFETLPVDSSRLQILLGNCKFILLLWELRQKAYSKCNRQSQTGPWASIQCCERACVPKLFCGFPNWFSWLRSAKRRYALLCIFGHWGQYWLRVSRLPGSGNHIYPIEDEFPSWGDLGIYHWSHFTASWGRGV